MRPLSDVVWKSAFASGEAKLPFTNEAMPYVLEPILLDSVGDELIPTRGGTSRRQVSKDCQSE